MNCKNWYAWINMAPPKPDDFHVVGEVLVGNPGVEAILSKREPQGTNPTILLLDLHLAQKPGMWVQVMTCAQVRFDKILTSQDPLYGSVQIFHEGTSIAVVDVDEIQ